MHENSYYKKSRCEENSHSSAIFFFQNHASYVFQIHVSHKKHTVPYILISYVTHIITQTHIFHVNQKKSSHRAKSITLTLSFH